MTTGARVTEGGLPAPPPTLLDAVDERCRALAATASGRVFRVPADDVEAALRSECNRGARYDTILSFMRTPQVADLEGFVADLEGILADDGWILVVEPAGTGGRPVRRLPARLRRRSPDHRRGGRDVVSALRSRGLFVTDIHRREAPSVPPAWRRYVELRARRQSRKASDP